MEPALSYAKPPPDSGETRLRHACGIGVVVRFPNRLAQPCSNKHNKSDGFAWRSLRLIPDPSDCSFPAWR